MKISVPMDEGEVRMLRSVSKRSGRSMAGWVRWAVRDAYESASKTPSSREDCAIGIHHPMNGGVCEFCGAKC